MPPYEILSILLGFLPCQHSDVFRNHTNLLQKSLAGMSLLGNNILEIKQCFKSNDWWTSTFMPNSSILSGKAYFMIKQSKSTNACCIYSVDAMFDANFCIWGRYSTHFRRMSRFFFYISYLQGLTIQQYKIKNSKIQVQNKTSKFKEILYVTQQGLYAWRTHKHK